MNLTEVKVDMIKYNSFKEKAKVCLNNLKGTITNFLQDIIKIEESEELVIHFIYMGRRFETRAEIPIGVKDLKKIQISTYVDPEDRIKDYVFVFSYPIDELGMINVKYTEDNFSEYYLEEMLPQAKNKLFELGKPIVIK